MMTREKAVQAMLQEIEDRAAQRVWAEIRAHALGTQEAFDEDVRQSVALTEFTAQAVHSICEMIDGSEMALDCPDGGLPHLAHAAVSATEECECCFARSPANDLQPPDGDPNGAHWCARCRTE